MDMNKFAASDSKDLKAKDFVGKNLRVVIESVSQIHYEATDTQPATDRARLTFEKKDKGLVLNPSNTKILIDAYGSDSDDWIGHAIGLSTRDYTDKGFGHGWFVTPLDIEAPAFNDEVPF